MRTRLQLAVLAGAGILAIAAIASVIRSPDTMDGGAMPGYMAFRISEDLVRASLGFCGVFLGSHFTKRARFPVSMSVGIVAIDTLWLYARSLFSKPVTITLDATGHISSSAALWWPPIEPLFVPLALTLVITRLPAHWFGNDA